MQATGMGFRKNTRDAIVECDKWVGKIYSWLKENGLSGNTILYITTDHGWNEDFKRHDRAPRSWLITNDREIKRGGTLPDLAVTILDRFGVNWKVFEPPLVGRPLTREYSSQRYPPPSENRNIYSIIPFNINLRLPEHGDINIKTI